MALFKRLYIAVSRRTTRVMPGVLVAAQETLKLAQAAQLPLCAPAFNIALEILNIFQASHGSRGDFWSLTFVIHWQQAIKDAASASNELLQTLRVYDETVGHMVEILSPDYLESSDDVQARIARKSIAEFEKEMASVKTILDGITSHRTWKKALNNSQIKADIEQCTRKLVATREKFNSSTMMVILANTKATQLGDFDVDEFRIPGATSLKPTDIKIGSKVTRYWLLDENDPANFWEDTHVAIVRGQKKLAKFYTPYNGGEDAFLRDIQRLGRNIWPNLPSVFGHCRRSSVPFIIFDNSHMERFSYYIKNLARSNPQNAILTVWNMLVNLRDAADFLASNDAEIHDRAIEDAVRDPSVNEIGEIILSPQVKEEEYPDYYYMLRTSASDQLNLDLMVYTGWTGVLLNSRLRPLRSLGLALEGDAEAVLNTNISTLEDHSTELHKYWPEARDRNLIWCLGEQGDLAPGDVGVFRSDHQTDMMFERLGSVADELGGVNSLMGENCCHESVSDRIFRFTYDPAGDGEAHRILHELGLTMAWHNELRDKKCQSEYFLSNVQRLSELYNVPPEELVIITETSNTIFGDPFEEVSTHLTRPVHSYLHLSNRGHVDQVYWSYESVPGAPFSEEELTELPFPELEMSPLCSPSHYFQVELEDLEPISS